jgi:glucose/arabinose dehydrogenase
LEFNMTAEKSLKVLSSSALLLFVALSIGLIRAQVTDGAVSAAATPPLNATSIATGFMQPTDIANAGDYRLFVAERQGIIRIINPDNSIVSEPFLNIQSLVVDSHQEQGLLGLVFHPNYPETPYFFITHTAAAYDGDVVVARYTVSADPYLADAGSRKEILRIPQPFDNHNGGDLNFGPDGYLYISTGDGGSGFDPQNNAQNPNSLLGKILRIDVDQGDPYTIPGDNPFVGDSAYRDEIWALGLRNPWRFSFDRATGDLFIADVGQGDFEEVNFQPTDSAGGENYGWRCYEGLQPTGLDGCAEIAGYIPPIDDYPHRGSGDNDVGYSVTGGFVYRGSQFPALNGYYIYADFGSSNFWLAQKTDGTWQTSAVGPITGFTSPSTFGESCDGELFAAGYGGAIFQIGAAVATVALPHLNNGFDQFIYLPQINSASGCRDIGN